jgi:formiminotetrahydrofolate cyclodeaminase
MPRPSQFEAMTVGSVMESLSDPESAIASSASAGLSVAFAGSLLVMVCRGSKRDWDDGGGYAGQVSVLASRAVELAPRAQIVFQRALERLAGEFRDGESEAQRDWMLGQALREAAKVPLLIGLVGRDIADVSSEVVGHCAESLRPDAVAAARLATAAVEVCADLVVVNLGVAEDDERAVQAARLRGDVATALSRTTAAVAS